MKDKRFHLGFWTIYLACITSTIYLMDIDNFLFPLTIVDIVLSNFFTSILPFYGFYYIIPLILQKRSRVKGIIYCLALIGIKFSIEYYGYQSFQNFLYGTHLNYSFKYMAGLAMASDFKILIFAIAFYYISRNQKTEKRVLTLQNEKLAAAQKKLQAEVAYFRAQINPHFLHNVLNFFYAQALPYSGKLADGIMILSDIMRYALDKVEDENEMVLLSKEIEMVKKVIKINQLRYEDRLNIEIRQTGGDIGQLRIIPMVLITLVENALKHGDIHSSNCPVNITAHFDELQNQFIFTVFNCIKKGPKEISHGIGLENTRSRLQIKYGNAANLKITDTGEKYEAVFKIKY
jgi:sensor histidine kinase YesM